MSKLNIAPGLHLPREAVTQTFSILAKRGVGKTYLASVLVEEMVKSDLMVAIIDPTGAWWGLRHAADGKGPGLAVIVLGGEHGDVPLEPTSGQVVADFVVDYRKPCVLDLRLMRKGEQKRFVLEFAERLYHRNREPLHLVIDEADAFAPQRPFKGEERVLGAIDDLVRRARTSGIGVTLVTQRSAVLNKNVLSQTEVLVALRTIAPQDRKAIEAWVEEHEGDDAKAQGMLDSLRSLPIGTAWFWSPGWLNIFQKVEVRERETFNSSATPKVGERRITPRNAAVVDLDDLKLRIAATIEKAKSEDPKELHKRIAALEGELAAHKRKQPSTPQLQKPVLSGSQINHLRTYSATVTAGVEKLVLRLRNLEAETTALVLEISKAIALASSESPKEARIAAPAVPAVQRTPRAVVQPTDAEGLSKPQLYVLQRMAMLKSIGFVEVDKVQLAYFCGVRWSGGFRNNLSALHNRDPALISYGSNGTTMLTPEGEAVVGSPPPPPSLDEFREEVYRLFSTPQGRILRVLVEELEGEAISKTELAAKVGVDYTGGFRNNLSPLHRSGVVEYPGGGTIRASAVMFNERLGA